MTIARRNILRMMGAGMAVSAVLVAASACGSGGTSSSGAGTTTAAARPSPSLAVCQNVNAIRDTLGSLAPIKGSALPTSAQLKAAASSIQSSLAALGNRTEWQPEIDNLKAAAANLQTAAENIAASPGARGAAASVRTAVAQVNDSIRRLLTAVGSRCPSPSAGPS
jgi:hypothetical protein